MYMLYENYTGLQPKIIIDKSFPLNDIGADQSMYLLAVSLLTFNVRSSGSMPENGLWMFNKDCSGVSSEKNSVF